MFQVILILAVFLVPYFCSDNLCHLPETLPITSLLAYVHVGFWFLFLLLHQYIRMQHNTSRRYGYGMFYRRTLCLRRLTFYVSSVGWFTHLIGSYTSRLHNKQFFVMLTH